MTISPISSLGSDFGSVPRNYSVSNESEVSSVYRARMQQGVAAADRIELASPVQYPNADITAKQTEKTQNAIGAEKSFNDIAAKFQGAQTTYNMNALSQSYGMSGSTINLMA